MSRTCLFITGSSGVGKSTLLQSCLNADWPAGQEVFVPLKYCTRELRSADEAVELKSTTDLEFDSLLNAGIFQINYEFYGARYALLKTEFESTQDDAICIQAIPTFVALKLREVLAPTWNVRICLLQAGEQEVKRRLSVRDAKCSKTYFDQRVYGARFDFSKEADKVISTECTKEQVYTEFRNWALGAFSFDKEQPESKHQTFFA